MLAHPPNMWPARLQSRTVGALQEALASRELDREAMVALVV